MEVLYPRCAGLDVHRDTIVACARIATGSEVQLHLETFSTMTSGLLAMSDWLHSHGVTHVAMEATGVYWKPAWQVLEASSFELVLANAMHVKNVPGRKTDVNDATWIADLLAHGLVRSSFVPPAPIQELRALTRTRKQLVREKASHVQRIDKILQQANIKLGSVLSDLQGTSARAILDALAAGENDPDKLVALVTTRVKASKAELREALRGSVAKHHRFLIKLHLGQVDVIDKAIETIDAEVGDCLKPFQDLAGLLSSVPGVSAVSAAVIIAEIGIDMSRFPTAGHLVSWAGLCPKSDESAGKRRSTRVRKGAPWLKTLLVQCAWCATRAKNTYLRAQYHRVRGRRGPKKAILAVAASMLTAIYFMLKDGVVYQDLGPDHFDRADRNKTAHRLLKRLADLGFEAQLKDLRAAA
jgi:transposase